MDIKQLNDYGTRLEHLFKLRSMPIAVKWYEKSEDIPLEAIRPKQDLGKHMAVCQAFSYARMKGKTVALCRADHWCWNPLIGYGLVECLPGQAQFDEVCKYIGIPDRDKAAKFFENFPRLPLNRYEAFVVAPLRAATFIPDVVLIYADVAKTNHMVRCIKSAIGNYIHSVFDGIDSCIYCTVPSFLNNEYKVTFPDPGERERAETRDDEVILTVPGSRIKEFMDAVEETERTMGFSDRMIEINLDFYRPPFYNTLFEMWGLDSEK